MRNHTATTTAKRTRRADSVGASSRERGSLLILCVTVLVIIALIGIAFLQRVRMDQFATARHERSYINLVINGILGDVGNEMELDVLDNQKDGHLLYDYPWTNHGLRDAEATQEYPSPSVVPVNGYRHTGNNVPGHEDDRWLASTAPVWSQADSEYRWLHLTNLTGIWVHLPDGSDTTLQAVESVIDGTESQMGNARESDTDLSLANRALDGLGFKPGGFETRGTDADGDGILDSMWQWAPVDVRKLGGNRYVMALRIVDLNSMLNVNTATALTHDGGSGMPWVAGGHNPIWIDLSRLLERTPGSYYTGVREWKDELSEMVRLRITPTTSLDAFDFNVGDLYLFETTLKGRLMWEEQGSVYGNTDRNYLMDSEMELRRFGGLNDRSLTSTLESKMGQAYPAGFQSGKALRQHPAISDDGALIGAEGSYLDVVDPLGTLTDNNEEIARWFYGQPQTGPFNDNSDVVPVKDREFPAVRHMLTAGSGTSVYTTLLPAVGGDPNNAELKFDLNRDWTDATADAKMDSMADQMRSVLKRSREGKTGKYLGLSDAQVDELIEEYVVCIKDYSDPDTVPTARTTGTGARVYGMERLPFLREVYVQALYADVVGDTSDRKPWDPLNDGSVGSNFVGWSPALADVGGKTYAMAIELGNPFNHVIYGTDPNSDSHTEGLDGQVEIRVLQDGAQIGSWLFDGSTPDIEPRNDSGDDDTLIVYSPPQDNLDTTLSLVPSDLPTELGFDPNRGLEVTPDALTNGFNPGGGPIVVELYVNTADGFVMYDRMALDARASLPSNIDHAPAGTAEHQFGQASSARDSFDINYIVDDGSGATDFNDNLPVATGSYDPTVDRFDTDSKGIGIALVAGPEFYLRLQLHLPDQPMRSVTELGLVHMFGFTAGEHFSERMSANFGIPENEHFLLIDPDDGAYGVIPAPYGVPHAALLMDMFSTVSPEDDGRDNDNDDGNNIATDGFDNDAELLVPGTPNVNTMPMHLMTLGSPLGETLDESEKLMRTIVAYRDEPLRGSRLRPADDHGSYWSVAEAGFDVQAIRNPLINPDYHLREFPNSSLDRPGIASLGELLSLNPGNPDNDMLRYGIDTTPGLPIGNATRRNGMDRYPDPDDVRSNDANSPIVPDDNEQLLARFGMLSQAYTVRSDRFVVYGVVRGYDSDTLSKAPVETARFIAVIDRGAMVDNPTGTATEKPRVIGFMRLQ